MVGSCSNCCKLHKQRTVEVVMMLNFNNFNYNYPNMIIYYDSIILMNSNAKFFRLF